MLTLSRKTDEAILIGSNIRIVIKRIDGEIVRIQVAVAAVLTGSNNMSWKGRPDREAAKSLSLVM